MGHQFVTKTVAALLVPCMILTSVGCYSYQDITLAEAKADEHLIVGTKDGRWFRLATWTADSPGNISGRGAEYATLEYAQGLHTPRPFKGTIPADSIAVLQADKPDTKATVGLVVAIVLALVVIGAVVASNSDFLHSGNGEWNWN